MLKDCVLIRDSPFHLVCVHVCVLGAGGGGSRMVSAQFFFLIYLQQNHSPGFSIDSLLLFFGVQNNFFGEVQSSFFVKFLLPPALSPTLLKGRSNAVDTQPISLLALTVTDFS